MIDTAHLAEIDFYPRPPRGGRPDCAAGPDAGGHEISTHALHEEGDMLSSQEDSRLTEISTHALHEEGDAGPGGAQHDGQYFYPRPPRGGRRRGPSRRETPPRFLPTPSTRRATQSRCILE